MYKLQLPPDCPCSGAEEWTGCLYRIILGDTLTDDDLVSYAEKHSRHRDQCVAYGLSLFKTRTDARKAYLDAKGRNKHLGTHVAGVNVRPNHGKLHTESSSHCTLWLYSNVTAADFECLAVHRIEARDGTDEV